MQFYDADPNRITVMNTPGLIGLRMKGEEDLLFNNGKTSTRVITIPNSNNFDIAFKEINAYFKQLPIDKQKEIFNSYKDIKQALTEIVEPNMLMGRLSKLVGNLYANIDYDDLSQWLHKNVNFNIPSKIVNRYEDMEISERKSDNRNYRITTYIRSDYVSLMYLSVFIKPMLPIWAEYIRIIDSGSSKTTYRDYNAMMITKRIGFTEIDSFIRLREYIEENSLSVITQAGNKPDTTTAVLGGLSTQEIPDWLLSKTIVRKLPLVRLDDTGDDVSIISILYKNIESEMSSLSRKFSMDVMAKTKPKSGQEDGTEGKGVLDIYTMQQEFSDGDVMVTSVFMDKNIQTLKNQLSELLGGVIEANVLTDFYLENRNITNVELPTPEQQTIIGWILHKLIHFNGLSYLKTEYVKAKSLAQAFLWCEGFKELALYLSAKELKDDTGHLVGGLETRSLISKDSLDKMVELFPNHISKKSSINDRQHNYGCVIVNELAEVITRCDWVLNSPQWMTENNPLVDQATNVLTPPNDIRDVLVNLIVRLNQ